MNVSEFSLFIIEILKVKDDNIKMLDYGFENLVNGFIYKMHKDNPKLISIIFDIELLDELEGTNTELVSQQSILTIVKKYINLDNYLQLIEKIDIETSNKINDLALLFLKFSFEIYQEWAILMTPPQVKILQ